MNLVDTLRAFARRWYIVLPGMIVSVALALGAWHLVKPQYERTATQVLLPGEGSLPQTSPNPYLFISGLTEAADVVVRTAGSNNVINDVTKEYPGVKVEIARDPTTSGPVILTTVTAGDERDAAKVLQLLVKHTTMTLAHLQTEERIGAKYQIKLTTLSIDDQSQLKQRKRLLASGGAGGGALALTLLLASVADGLLMRRKSAREHNHVGSSARRRRHDEIDVGAVAKVDDHGPASAPVVESYPPDAGDPVPEAVSGSPGSYGRRAASAAAASPGTRWPD